MIPAVVVSVTLRLLVGLLGRSPSTRRSSSRSRSSGRAIAATILPWWKQDIFENSPVARTPRVCRSSASPGLITSIFLGWMIYHVAVRTRSTGSASATPTRSSSSASCTALAAVVYVVARARPPPAGRRPRRHPLGDPGRVAADAICAPGAHRARRRPMNDPLRPLALRLPVAGAARRPREQLRRAGRPDRRLA